MKRKVEFWIDKHIAILMRKTGNKHSKQFRNKRTYFKENPTIIKKLMIKLYIGEHVLYPDGTVECVCIMYIYNSACLANKKSFISKCKLYPPPEKNPHMHIMGDIAKSEKNTK